jgi:hypothetical protein
MGERADCLDHGAWREVRPGLRLAPVAIGVTHDLDIIATDIDDENARALHCRPSHPA